MSEVTEDELKRRKHVLDSLAAKNKANGATEEEMGSAIDLMTKLMQKWVMEDYDPDQKEAKYTVCRKTLNVKYANKWRWETANAIAWNVGILALHFKHPESIQFNGRELTVEAAAGLAEWVINQIEELSANFAKESGTGVTGKRRFARGCSIRVRQRIREACDLTADVRLPMVLEAAREEVIGLIGYTGAKKKKRSHDEDSLEFIRGYLKGDIVDIRKKDGQIAG